MLPKLHCMSEMFVASPDICQMQSWQACRSWDMAQRLLRTWVFCREHFLHKILGRWRSILALAVWWKRQWVCPQWKGAKWRNTSWISWFFWGFPCTISALLSLLYFLCLLMDYGGCVHVPGGSIIWSLGYLDIPKDHLWSQTIFNVCIWAIC